MCGRSGVCMFSSVWAAAALALHSLHGAAGGGARVGGARPGSSHRQQPAIHPYMSSSPSPARCRHNTPALTNTTSTASASNATPCPRAPHSIAPFARLTSLVHPVVLLHTEVPKKTCMSCHADPLGDSSNLKKPKNFQVI